jgi:hypothetical protein
MSRTLVVANAFALALIAAIGVAVAQDHAADGLIGAACADNGALLKALVGLFGTTAAASLFANLRNRLPAGVVTVLDLLAFNFVRALEASADTAKKTAPLLLALVLAGVLGACQAALPSGQAATTDPVSATILKLGAVALPDLQAAAADAKAHNDLIAAQCWSGLVPIAQQLQAQAAAQASTAAPQKPLGVVSAFQDARDAKAGVNQLMLALGSVQLAQLRQAVDLACGPLVVDAQAGIADPFGLISGPAPAK